MAMEVVVRVVVAMEMAVVVRAKAAVVRVTAAVVRVTAAVVAPEVVAAAEGTAARADRRIVSQLDQPPARRCSTQSLCTERNYPIVVRNMS